jgi:primosomal protein N' (replication factor Y)
MSADAQPGVRVRVRFGAGAAKRGGRNGGLIDGIIVERLAESDFKGALARIERVLSPEVVFPPYMLALARAVADRYAGTLADVVQLALPPRHARAEGQPSEEPLPEPAVPDYGTWSRYPAAPGFLDRVAAGESPRAVWVALPGPSWAREIAVAVGVALAAGRGALVVVPDGKDVGVVDEALEMLLGAGRHVALTAGLGPEERYRRWLAVRRGAVKAVVGTRAAVFAPVADLGLAVVWDDGDGSHEELHAPYPHVREVLEMRAVREKAAFVVGGRSVTVEAAQLVETGWAEPLVADRVTVRATAPLVRTIGDVDVARDEGARSARLPTLAWDVARKALESGPVLVQVPRRGYIPRASCNRCREPAMCDFCHGTLEMTDGQGALVCAWCARHNTAWRCPVCGGDRLRASVVGARRTAEELGRAFPKVPVRTSGRDAVLSSVPDLPALIISTPGAEPVAAGGYAAALLLDGWALLSRPDLRAGEDALRRWLDAASLVRSSGSVVVVADPALRPVQALVRWDPAGFARQELVERAELGLPPVSRMASVTGIAAAVGDFLSVLRLPEGTDVLGPVQLREARPMRPPADARRRKSEAARAEIVSLPSADVPLWEKRAVPEEPVPVRERVLLRVSPGGGAALAAALKHALAVQLARKSVEPVRVRVDPPDVG